MKDCNLFEKTSLSAIAFLIILLGIYPSAITNNMQNSIWKIVEPFSISTKNTTISNELALALQLYHK